MMGHARACALATALTLSGVMPSQASIITDFLDRIGGCRRPMQEGLSREVAPFTPMPYGKALANWTDQDLADFRAYFLDCQRRSPAWNSMGEYNRNDAIRVIDTAVSELRFKVGMARDSAGAQRSIDEVRAQEASAERAKQLATAKRNATLDEQIGAVTKEQKAFIERGMESLTPDEKVTRLDGLLAKIKVLETQSPGLPSAPALWDLERTTIEQRSEVIREVRRAAMRRPPPPIVAKPATGPYASFALLRLEAVSAALNPLQQEQFRTSLRSRGVDLTARIGGIEPSGDDWLVRLTDRVANADRPGNGYYCRVAATDTASMGILRAAAPGISAVQVVANNTAEFLMLNNPVRLRIVLSPCRLSAPLDSSFNPMAADASDDQPLDLPTSTPPKRGKNSTKDEPPPVAPSPPDLRCETEVSRQRGQWTAAHRLRRLWQIPEALRSDPSLVVSLELTKNYTELTEPPIVTRSQSKKATPEEMQATVEAAHRAISEAAPFPELGPSSLGPIKIDMIPCD